MTGVGIASEIQSTEYRVKNADSAMDWPKVYMAGIYWPVSSLLNS